MKLSTTEAHQAKRMRGVSLEIKTTIGIIVVLVLLFVALLGVSGAHAGAGLAVGTAIAAVVIAVTLHFWIYRPLHDLIARSRRRLGGTYEGTDPFYRNELAELEHLVNTLVSVFTSAEDQETTNASIRDDLVRLREYNRQLVEIDEIGQEIGAALPYRETVDRALAGGKRFLRADFVALLLHDSETRTFSVEGSLGVNLHNSDPSCCLSTPDCPVRRAVTRGKITRSSNHACSLFPQTMKGQLVIPLDVEAVGEMALLATATSAATFDVLSDDIVALLQNHVCTALGTAHKFDAIRRQVVTDHLTRLYNRRYFMSRAAEEVERSLQNQAPMSVVMIDIDNFKLFNDNYGHSTGDRVLQAVATIMQSAVRTSDVCARHGGEEFIMLLPNTPGDSAIFLAERVRSMLAATRYTGLGLPNDANITISAGVATCPRDATTSDDLVELADKALYRAKAAGRNQVCQYGVESDRLPIRQ
jgi:diguanylate cyclase (GGDEF)-like protein